MEGDFVVVQRADGGLLRRVVEANDAIVFIASPDEFELRALGLSALEPVPFPRRFVYRAEGNAEALLAAGCFSWDSATPY
jgi:hypothetical protein